MFSRKHLFLQRLTLTICVLVLTLDSTPGQVLKGKGLSAADAVLSIRAKESSVKSGAAMWVDVTVENKSDHILLVYRALTAADDDQGGWVYDADIHDEKGGRPQPTKFKGERGGIGSGGYIHLQPGKTMTDRINICKLYDISRPGKYSIQVYRYGMGDTMLLSNTINMTVSP